MPDITFLPLEKTIQVPEGISVLQAELQAAIPQDAPCGGHGKCGKCMVLINGRLVRACQTIIHGNVTVTVGRGIEQASILTEGSGTAVEICPVSKGRCHVAVDIGTTTIVVYLLDADNGNILDTKSRMNPQYPYGADVISRIQAAVKGSGKILTKLVRDTVWELILQLCTEHEYTTAELGTVAIVANPAMQQLFYGVMPDNLMRPPFIPEYKKTDIIQMSECFPTDDEGSVLLVPDIAGYIGADTMGCVLSTEMYQDTKMTLMIDIGTNGEMVLGNQSRMTACATAAGPALEGGRISCGMRGSGGAIDHIWTEAGRVRYSVIGNKRAAGICGSGIIDAIAVMLRLGLINRRGRIQKEYKEMGRERVYPITDQIALTQTDIREVQMAKGAIAAGIQIMMNYLEITEREIDRVILCGAFGNYMNPENACSIGLLPESLLDRVTAGGNAAGMGGRLMALNQNLFYMTDELIKKIEPLELESFPDFQRIFASKMLFKER